MDAESGLEYGEIYPGMKVRNSFRATVSQLLKKVGDECSLTYDRGDSWHHTVRLVEIRPILYNAVNVAGIEVKENLLVANIAVDIDMSLDKERSVDEWLLSFFQSAFSFPINNPDDYIPSQVIAEF